MTYDDAKPIETLRLNGNDKRALVEHLNRSRQRSAGQDERRGLRVEYAETGVVVAVTHPNGSVTTYSVVPRNLSTHGFGFVHGRFLYIDSPCEVDLPRLDGGKATVTGRIVHCRKLTGITHEISLVFDEPIDLGRFVALDEGQKQQAARELTGAAEAGLMDAIEPALDALDVQSGVYRAIHTLDDLTRRLAEAGSDDLVESMRNLTALVTAEASAHAAAELTRAAATAHARMDQQPFNVEAVQRSVEELIAIAQQRKSV